MLVPISHNSEYILNRFFVVGVTHSNASAVQRSVFALSELEIAELLSLAKKQGLKSCMVVSTCNRCELYGFCENESVLANLFLRNNSEAKRLFPLLGFTYQGGKAVHYLFSVAAGLNSQILGDYEILSQLKQAVQTSRNAGLIGTVMDRLLNFAFQSSKAIKTHTSLSNGTVSVSYAVIQWLRQYSNTAAKRVLVVGTGALGESVVKNIQNYLPVENIQVSNRTNEKAKTLAILLGVTFLPFESLELGVANADIIIVCTNASKHILAPNSLYSASHKVFIDLAVPSNIHPEITTNSHSVLVGIDEVSQTMHKTIASRKNELPKAEQMVNDYENEFYKWLNFYKHTPAIQHMRHKLYNMQANVSIGTACTHTTEKQIQKTIGVFANSVKSNAEVGCAYIQAMHSFLCLNNCNEY